MKQLGLFEPLSTEPHTAPCPGCGITVLTFMHADWFPSHYGIKRASTWSNHQDWRPGDHTETYAARDQHGGYD